MMLPARTVSPPNFFTPRRLLSLSRPLRDEPPAFLCAMSSYFFGAFLAPTLAGGRFFVDALLAAGLAGAAFFAAGLSAPAAFSLLGAGFSVGVPATSPAFCWSVSLSAFCFACAAGSAAAGALVGLLSALGAASAFGAAF